MNKPDVPSRQMIPTWVGGDLVAVEKLEAHVKGLKHMAVSVFVMCGNDVLAAGALRKAADMGLDVPGDVSITGFDDIELAEILRPGLTTVHVPHREMGRRSAKALIDLRNGKAPGDSLQLPAKIKWRDTLGPAKETA